jgi:hypothetical protein
MRWIEKTRTERQADTQALLERITTEQYDRFWYSDDQDGKDTQLMHIKLPIQTPGDMYFEITMMTVQLYAARNAAAANGQAPGQKIAITPSLLAAIEPCDEHFQFNHDNENGIGLQIIVNAPGLTHDLIDAWLLDFIKNGQQPIKPKPVSPSVIRERLIEARENGLHALFTL